MVEICGDLALEILEEKCKCIFGGIELHPWSFVSFFMQLAVQYF